MKGYRFYAEMPGIRSSKSASKHWSAFTRELLQQQAARGWHNNVIAVLLGEDGQPLWCGKDRNQMDAFVAVSGRSNSPVELGVPSEDYLRKRCVRIDAGLAKKLHPNLFAYLEKST